MCTILKKVLVVFMLIFSTILSMSVAFGQVEYFSYPDTIRVQMPNETTIEYAMRYKRDLVKHDRQKLQEEKELKEKIEQFLKRWEVLGIKNLEEKKPLFIEDLDEKIKISERDEKTLVLFPKDAKVALVVKGKHKLQLDKTGNDVFIYFNKIKQLEELVNYNLQKIFEASDKQLAPASADKKNKRKPLNAWISVNKDDEVGLTYQKFVQEKTGNKHNILLSFSPNIENINGDWLSGISLTTDWMLNNKYRIGFGYEFMYNFSGKKTTNISHWGNFRAMVNSEAIGNSWVGISLGYLIKQRGDFFDNNKFRLGIPVRYDNFTVTPEIYFKKPFKSADKKDKYFGVKISFGL